MNKIEHLLQCLAEEAGEIVQASMKCTRFALDGHYPDGRRNSDVVKLEVNDLIGVMELLQEECPEFRDYFKRDLINAKKIKVVRHMEVARERGTLE